MSDLLRTPDLRPLARPIVRHGLAEHRAGASVSHVLWESTMAGILVGQGRNPIEAIAVVEQMEDMGMVPGYETEPPWWHREERRWLARMGYPVPGAEGYPPGGPEGYPPGGGPGYPPGGGPGYPPGGGMGYPPGGGPGYPPGGGMGYPPGGGMGYPPGGMPPYASDS